MDKVKRTCGTCTKCCEGALNGIVRSIPFHKGKPCHFVEIGKGCSIYSERPIKPCVEYKCSWLKNEDIPVWMKPNEVNALIDERSIDGIPYLSLKEAGATMSARVLSWFILYGINNNLNIHWGVEGGEHWLGSLEFCEAFREESKSSYL